MAKPFVQRVPFEFHPRVFGALGSDLVTNDLVAITELVKNAYDAFATRVDVEFREDPQYGPVIEVADNGQGMSEQTIKETWCMVATPHREMNAVNKNGSKSRMVSGEKGLGRLSVARLGDRLEMYTKAPNEEGLKVVVDWTAISKAKKVSQCTVDISEEEADPPIVEHGTRLIVLGLKSEWNEEQFEELRDYLSRLISPFRHASDFKIWLTIPGDEGKPVQIQTTEFLNRPKYRIAGALSKSGQLKMTYAFTPVQSAKPARTKVLEISWDELKESWAKTAAVKLAKVPLCGPFKFEVRAWDIGLEDVDEIVDQFQIRKGMVRAAIKAHKGISIYRDEILVLPKSESSRDWLGLDLRRVSDVGLRLSTSQIIGYVAITGKQNPQIKDTSDRERLVHGPAVKAGPACTNSVFP